MSLHVAFCVIAALSKDHHLPLETCRQLIFGEDVSFRPHFSLTYFILTCVDEFGGTSVMFINLEQAGTQTLSSVLLGFLTSAVRLKDAPVWAANKRKPRCPDCATCRLETAARAIKMTVVLSWSYSNTSTLPSLFFSSSTRTHQARWAPSSSAQPCKLSVATCAWPAQMTRCPFDLWASSCPPSRQECSAIGGRWSCCLSALHLEPCSCPSTASCHASPGCAHSSVTRRHLSAFIHKAVFSAQSQCMEF